MSDSTDAGDSEPINGIEMYYEKQGSGEPLVLLHGGGGIGANWRLVFSAPTPGFQLVIPDLRGHGRSTNPAEQFTFRQCALDVFELLDRLAIDRFKAIGMSMGAKTLLHMATQQPTRVEAMVLISATPYFPHQARAIMETMTPENRTDEEWRQMREWHPRGDEQILALWRQARAFKDSYDDMNFTPPHLATIKARTLIVHGDRDPLYPVSLAFEMYASIPRAYLWVIPNGGHGPIFREFAGSGETTGRFAETALTFLRGEWKNQSGA
ncbi:MAG TPA: alpha/beta hydrolase [Blastocatellia bacterium]|nr:alpha/beta hydrolase [Blastocatellia bacterium]